RPHLGAGGGGGAVGDGEPSHSRGSAIVVLSVSTGLGHPSDLGRRHRHPHPFPRAVQTVSGRSAAGASAPASVRSLSPVGVTARVPMSRKSITSTSVAL